MSLRQAGKKRPAPATALAMPSTGDAKVDQALVAAAGTLAAPAAAPQMSTVTVELIPGLNKVAHGLGRPPVAVNVVQLGVANGGFAWAWVNSGPPRLDVEIWLDVIGAPTTSASIQYW